MVYPLSPIYPSLESDLVADNEELDALLETTSSCILHIQCSSDASSVSEMVRNYLDVNRARGQMLLYFRFSAHDVRFNNMQTMLSTFISQIAYNQMESHSSAISIILRDYKSKKSNTAEDMSQRWAYLRWFYLETLPSGEFYGPALV